jgi:hypothetical protein
LYRYDVAAFGDDVSGGARGGDTPMAEAVAAAVRSVQSLIGYFDLDPNRALDLVLEAYEQKPSNNGFLQLLGKVGTFHSCYFAVKAQLMTARVVHVINLGNPESEQPYCSVCFARKTSHKSWVLSFKTTPRD